MSWQSYVDDHLMCDIEGHHLTAAAIIGHDGSVWSQSASFPQFKQEEITGIMNDFNEPGFLAPTGLFLGATKYMVIQGEPGSVIRGKKMMGAHSIQQSQQALRFCWLNGCEQGSGGITIKKTRQALIFGIYDEPLTPGQCNMIVERMGDYLIDQGL